LTPPVFYFFDDYTGLPIGAPTFPGTPSKGRLVGVTYGSGSEGTYYKYDNAGRIAINHQRQGTSNYATSYTYNRAGAVTVETRGNPARRRNQMFYDEAGRLTMMKTGSYPFNAFTTLVNDISYTSSGALQSEKYGNGLIHSMDYNNRLQLTETRLGRQENLESVFRISYIFGTAHNANDQDSEITPANNNGNIARIKYFISGTLQYSQTFQYDAVNRLLHAVEHNNGVYDDGARAWYQTFDYGQFGNRGINPEYTSDNVDATNTALKLADFSEANNRITRAGHVYDPDGNLIAEPGKSYTYDAEKRIVMATVAGGVTSQYIYDGMGRRVKKIVGGVGTRFEYGAWGELIVEWNDTDTNKIALKDYLYKGGGMLATTKAGGGYDYATADHLGSPRAWTDSDGTGGAGGRHDYLPFGGELFAGYGTRTADQGYAASAQQDGQRKQFGSQEHDGETGLDFMQARYYSSLQGRFTSVDPINITALRMLDPQRLNLYSFARNNPLSYTDPTGMDPESEEERRKKIQEEIEAAKKKNPGLPVPTVAQVETGISVIWGLNGYNYEPADDAMTGPLAAAYVTAYQNGYQALEDGKIGSTDPQSVTVKKSESETNSKTVGGKVGGELTISKDPSLKFSGEVNQSNTGSGTGAKEVQMNANIRISVTEGARSSERQRAQFVGTFGIDGPGGKGMGADLRTSYYLGIKDTSFHNRTSYPEKLNQDYAGRIFDRVQSAAVSEVNRVFHAGRK
jgi:RHS repeat-associated protein